MVSSLSTRAILAAGRASGAEALSALEEVARRDQPVAMIVSDHRMPHILDARA
jgi:hypothetical protein